MQFTVSTDELFDNAVTLKQDQVNRHWCDSVTCNKYHGSYTLLATLHFMCPRKFQCNGLSRIDCRIAIITQTHICFPCAEAQHCSGKVLTYLTTRRSGTCHLLQMFSFGSQTVPIRQCRPLVPVQLWPPSRPVTSDTRNASERMKLQRQARRGIHAVFILLLLRKMRATQIKCNTFQCARVVGTHIPVIGLRF